MSPEADTGHVNQTAPKGNYALSSAPPVAFAFHFSPQILPPLDLFNSFIHPSDPYSIHFQDSGDHCFDAPGVGGLPREMPRFFEATPGKIREGSLSR